MRCVVILLLLLNIQACRSHRSGSESAESYAVAAALLQSRFPEVDVFVVEDSLGLDKFGPCILNQKQLGEAEFQRIFADYPNAAKEYIRKCQQREAVDSVLLTEALGKEVVLMSWDEFRSLKTPDHEPAEVLDSLYPGSKGYFFTLSPVGFDSDTTEAYVDYYRMAPDFYHGDGENATMLIKRGRRWEEGQR